MKHAKHTTAILSFTLICGAWVIGCQEPPKAAVDTSKQVQGFQLKPDRVARTKASEAALGELTRFERPLKTILQTLRTSPTGPALAADPYADCRKSAPSPTDNQVITWTCGLSSTESGKKEIEGRELINYDRATRTATYTVELEVRNFADKEERAKAHTVIIRRNAIFVFNVDYSAITFTYHSTSGLKNLIAQPVGSGNDWGFTIRGQMKNIKNIWTIDQGTTAKFEGALFGNDGERGTAYAAGEFNFTAEESGIALPGLSDGSCPLPVGSWKLTAVGKGERVAGLVTTNGDGGTESSGGTFSWNTGLCNQP